MKRLLGIQKCLRVRKNQYSEYGDYRYRSCEDIVEAVKPLLAERELILLMSDDVVQLGERFYVKATATLRDCEKELISVSAFAREAEHKTKMDDAQVTGAASSYARKYALNGLFAIDDVKDPDGMNDVTREEEEPDDVTPKKKVSAKCPHCGKMTSKSALAAWGMCSACKTKQVKEKKDE